MSNIVLPQGVDPKQLDAMMQGQQPQMIQVQAQPPKAVQDAQKAYLEEGAKIYSELSDIEMNTTSDLQSGDIIIKTLKWMMKGSLPFETVQKIDAAHNNQVDN